MTPSSIPSANSSAAAATFAVSPQSTTGDAFIDRRDGEPADGSSERRQFGSSHSGLSSAGHELATAIDQYKLQHHRRYITCDEMLTVIVGLGYKRS